MRRGAVDVVGVVSGSGEMRRDRTRRDLEQETRAESSQTEPRQQGTRRNDARWKDCAGEVGEVGDVMPPGICVGRREGERAEVGMNAALRVGTEQESA